MESGSSAVSWCWCRHRGGTNTGVCEGSPWCAPRPHGHGKSSPAPLLLPHTCGRRDPKSPPDHRRQVTTPTPGTSMQSPPMDGLHHHVDRNPEHPARTEAETRIPPPPSTNPTREPLPTRTTCHQPRHPNEPEGTTPTEEPPATYDRRDTGPTDRTYLNEKIPNELHTPLAPRCTDGDICRRQTHILGR